MYALERNSGMMNSPGWQDSGAGFHFSLNTGPIPALSLSLSLSLSLTFFLADKKLLLVPYPRLRNVVLPLYMALLRNGARLFLCSRLGAFRHWFAGRLVLVLSCLSWNFSVLIDLSQQNS